MALSFFPIGERVGRIARKAYAWMLDGRFATSVGSL
jgi:hypothetical protein